MSSQPVSLRRILIILGLLILPLLTIAASAGLLHASVQSKSQELQLNSSQTTPVSIIDFAFDPKVITITTGTRVRWTNNGASTHTSTSNTLVWDSGDILPGRSYTVTFNTPGDFPYHCFFHPLVMLGKVVVMGQLFLPVITN